MDIIFNKYQSHIKKYDDIMNQSNYLIIQIQLLLSDFITDLLQIVNDHSIPIDISFPLLINNKFELAKAEEIFLDETTYIPMLSLYNITHPVSWNDLTIAAQDLIANYIHIKIKSEDIYAELFH